MRSKISQFGFNGIMAQWLAHVFANHEVANSILVGALFFLFFAVFMMNLEFSTTNFTSFSELAFRFSLSTSILFYGLSFSVIMGVLGGMIPAVRASNIKIVDSLRAN